MESENNNLLDEDVKKIKQPFSWKKALKVTGITLASVVGVVTVALSSYLIYVVAQYSRIEDNQPLAIKNPVAKQASTNEELTFTSFNIGFGAYTHDYTFFLDHGVDADGTEKFGHWSTSKSKQETMDNTLGCIEALKNLDSDFIAVQEVDTKSNRAHFINQEDLINEKLKDRNYNETFACNFHSAYLAYPLYDPHGASTAGLQTLSKYQISSAIRKSYTITTDFPDKYFDLDRCYSANYVELKGSDKQLVLINSHMSAYDEGGKIRNKQLSQLNEFMLNEVNKGNYVIAGGDFNHDLLTNNPNPILNDANGNPKYYENENGHNYAFNEQYTQQRPYWVSMMFNQDTSCGFDDEFKIYASDNAPTCRGVDEPYTYGQTYVTVVDGFVCSSNIEVKSVVTTPISKGDDVKNFAYSDHQPTTLTFKLIA